MGYLTQLQQSSLTPNSVVPGGPIDDQIVLDSTDTSKKGPNHSALSTNH